jgi:hypothetical protein
MAAVIGLLAARRGDLPAAGDDRDGVVGLVPVLLILAAGSHDLCVVSLVALVVVGFQPRAAALGRSVARAWGRAREVLGDGSG